MHTVADLYAEVIGVLAQAKWVDVGACHHQNKQGHRCPTPAPRMREFMEVLMLCVPCLRKWPKAPARQIQVSSNFFPPLFFFSLDSWPGSYQESVSFIQFIKEGAGPTFCSLCPSVPKKFISFKSFFSVFPEWAVVIYHQWVGKFHSEMSLYYRPYLIQLS